MRHASDRRARRALPLTILAALALLVVTAPAALAAQIVGTEGSNLVLVGQRTDDVIEGLGGSDGLFGKYGNDYLDAGPGADYLFGARGTDTLVGGDGSDEFVAVGDGEVDTVVGGEGFDIAWVGAEDGPQPADVEVWNVDVVPPCWYAQAAAHFPAGCNTQPVGYAEGNATLVYGYAGDRDAVNPLEIHVVYTPPGGTRTFYASVTTSSPTYNYFSATHNLPSGTVIEVVAINVGPSGSPAGENELLGVVVVP